tara:strand:- start:44 stop:646 length:603 start_codon:yes stop_codon:yes gene_type:complete
MTLTNEAISAAQGLAIFDWPVFPVNPDTKAPLITGWQSRATCDRSGLIDLFKDYPSAAIGLVTGQKSGLVVIDIDERENFSGLQNFKNAGYELTPTVSASTPRGGLHLYFKAPSCEVPCWVSKIAEGVDIKSDGGFTIAPPLFLTEALSKFGGPRATRTPNLLIRSQMLYPIELWDRVQMITQKRTGLKAKGTAPFTFLY